RRAPYFRIRRDSAAAAWRWVLIGIAAGAGIAGAIYARSYITPASGAIFPTLPTAESTPTFGIELATPTLPEGVPTKDIFSEPPTITPTLPTPTTSPTPFIATIESQVTPPADASIKITAISSGISATLQPINANTNFPVGMPRFYIWLEY